MALGLGSGLSHPGVLGAFDGELSSPIPTSAIASGQYWATAPNHGWALVQLSKRPDLSATAVELAPAGSIAVEVRGGADVGEHVLIMRSDDGSGTARFGDVAPACVLSGLMPGAYSIALAHERANERSLSIVEVKRVRVTERVRSRVSFDLIGSKEAAGRRLVRVSGRISSSPQGDSELLSIDRVKFESVPGLFGGAEADQELKLGAGLEYRADERLWEWAPVRLAPGTYTMLLTPIGIRLRIDIPEAEAHVVDVSLPEMFEAEIEFVDSDTLEPVELGFVMPTTLLLDGPFVKPGKTTVTRRTSGGTVRVLASASPLHVMILDQRYGIQNRIFNLDVGSPNGTFFLTSPLHVSVALERYGEETFASPTWWKEFDLRRIDNDAMYLTAQAMPPVQPSNLVSFGLSRNLLMVPGPGKYRLTIPAGVAGPMSFGINILTHGDLTIDLGEETVELVGR